MKKEEIMINFTGIIFLIFGISALINTGILYGSVHILWFCYLGLIILGVGFLRRSHFLIESQLNILTIPLIIWAFDFFYFLIFGDSLLNIVNYFFIPGPITSKIITSQHIFTIPLALYSLSLIKEKTKKSWIFSFIQVSIIFIITRILTSPEDNINWVYHTSLNLNIIYYPLFWFIGIFLMIFISNLLIRRIIKH